MSDAAGQWSIVTKTPMGDQPATLKLEIDGDSITGTMTGAQGSVDLKDGKVEENGEMTWKASIPSPPITLEFKATVEGDSISGDVKLGAFGNATFSGTRA